MSKGATPQKSREIDAGLAVLNKLRPPGTCLSVPDIAEVCGCTKPVITQITMSALRKIRKQLS